MSYSTLKALIIAPSLTPVFIFSVKLYALRNLILCRTKTRRMGLLKPNCEKGEELVLLERDQTTYRKYDLSNLTRVMFIGLPIYPECRFFLHK